MISNLFNDALENFKKEYKPKATTSELPESRKLFWDQIPNELRKFAPNNNYEVFDWNRKCNRFSMDSTFQ